MASALGSAVMIKSRTQTFGIGVLNSYEADPTLPSLLTSSFPQLLSSTTLLHLFTPLLHSLAPLLPFTCSSALCVSSVSSFLKSEVSSGFTLAASRGIHGDAAPQGHALQFAPHPCQPCTPPHTPTLLVNIQESPNLIGPKQHFLFRKIVCSLVHTV